MSVTVVAPAQNAHILLNALNPHKVSWTAMAPPQLSRDAPILHVLHPAIPLRLGLFWGDDQLAGSSTLT
jgi:hypothetical protein